jgi:hypothetical protein
MGSIIRGMKKREKGGKKYVIKNFEFIYSHVKTVFFLITIKHVLLKFYFILAKYPGIIASFVKVKS